MRAVPAIALILCLAATCAPGVNTMKDNLPICTTLAECNAHDGERVVVAGVYSMYQYMAPTQLADSDIPVRILFAGDAGQPNGPMLSVFWMTSARRPAQEIARFKGKKVRVTGTFHRDQLENPDTPGMSTVGGPCIHPVESIEPVD
jgi:hypothetical protein